MKPEKQVKVNEEALTEFMHDMGNALCIAVWELEKSGHVMLAKRLLNCYAKFINEVQK